MHIQTTPDDYRIAWLLLIPHPALWRLFPLLMIAALLFGIINGIIAGAMTTKHRQCRT
jgi:heptaprenyl diphosphate synthase